MQPTPNLYTHINVHTQTQTQTHFSLHLFFKISFNNKPTRTQKRNNPADRHTNKHIQDTQNTHADTDTDTATEHADTDTDTETRHGTDTLSLSPVRSKTPKRCQEIFLSYSLIRGREGERQKRETEEVQKTPGTVA